MDKTTVFVKVVDGNIKSAIFRNNSSDIMTSMYCVAEVSTGVSMLIS